MAAFLLTLGHPNYTPFLNLVKCEGSENKGYLRDGDILYCSCQEGKRKNIIFYKNGKLENPSGFGNTLPVESYDRFAFNSTNLSPMTNSESQRYQYPVCHTLMTTQHPLSRFQSSARGPVLSHTRSPMSLNVGSRALSSKMIK